MDRRQGFNLYTIGDIGVDGALYWLWSSRRAIDELDMDGRFTMANMAIEAGGKAGIFKVDKKTLAYIKNKAKREYTVYEPDADASYANVIEYDVSKSNRSGLSASAIQYKPVNKLSDVRIDQAVIGSCTNGRPMTFDCQHWCEGQTCQSAGTLYNHSVRRNYMEALKEGLIETFIKAVLLSAPTCGLWAGTWEYGCREKCISTTNRNFVGRMGVLNRKYIWLIQRCS